MCSRDKPHVHLTLLFQSVFSLVFPKAMESSEFFLKTKLNTTMKRKIFLVFDLNAIRMHLALKLFGAHAMTISFFFLRVASAEAG